MANCAATRAQVWFTWIALEEEQGQIERADELRIRQVCESQKCYFRTAAT